MNRRYSTYLSAPLAVALVLSFSLVFAGGSLDDIAQRSLNCGVSSETVEQVDDLASSGAVSNDVAASLLSPLLSACVEQLPVAPLEAKLSEGMTKRVPYPIIALALKKSLDGYRFGRELLLTTTGTLDPKALKVVGEGIDRNVPKTDFETYAVTYGKQSPDAFLTGLDMVSLQGQAEYDFSLTSRILERGFASGNLTHDWHYFVRIILTARKRGIGDAAIADAAIAVLDKGGPVSDVLPELGFTGRDLGGDEKSE